MTEVWDYHARRYQSFAYSSLAYSGFGILDDTLFWPKYSMDKPFFLPVNVTDVNPIQ